MTEPPARTGAGAVDPIVERYDRLRHRWTDFSCGNPELDAYPIHGLDCDEADRAAVAYVLVDRTEAAAGRRVIGYFTLNSFALPRKQARLGIAVVVVHAIDDGAARFYEHHGFTPFRDEPSHLDYPLATFEAAVRDTT